MKDYREKDICIIGGKKYIIGVPTVGLYRLSLKDTNQFIRELFLEFNNNIPKLNTNQIEELIIGLFDIDEKLISGFVKDKSDEINLNKDFHIVIGQFMKMYPGNSYHDINNMPLDDFNNILRDSKIISGEEDYKSNKNKGPEKDKLRSLLNNY